ncbi:MAG: hypothetical protein J7507_04955 [Pseudoxanthomonas sp.]|nr:hypothetical protein [Pseudoxanthomonas sp.]
MNTAEGWAYAGYLVWLLAGCLDFARHRRTDLAHTSGLAESRLHGVQLGLLGGGVLAWLALAPSLLLGALLLALVIAHAFAGYADTRSAYGRRPIDPREQHLHSILDMAPWAALCFVVVTDGAQARSAGWTLAWQAAPAAAWLALLLPALPLCVLPWLVEYQAVLRARRI